LATDTLAAISFLHERYSSRISAIGVLGVSQGGQVAPIVATESDDVAFVINVVGSVVPFGKALLYEEINNLREMGFLPGVSDAIAHVSTWYIRKIAQKEFWDAVGDWDPLPYWQDVEVPALVLYGKMDTNVPSRASAERLNALGNPRIEVVVFQGSGHKLEDPPGRGNSYLRQEALRRMAEFILEASLIPTTSY
jgi:dienelactone hydrolase